MMRIIAKVVCNTCYWLGDIWSRTFLMVDCLGWTYPVYNTLMGWSYKISKKSNLDVWILVAEEEQ